MNSNYKFPRHLIYGVSAHSLNMWHTTVNKDIEFLFSTYNKSILPLTCQLTLKFYYVSYKWIFISFFHYGAKKMIFISWIYRTEGRITTISSSSYFTLLRCGVKLMRE